MHTAKTFREYIRGRRRSRSFAGHFVHDAKLDDTFPDAGTWEEVETYLRSVSARRQAIEGARSTWWRYNEYVRMNGTRPDQSRLSRR